MRKYNRGVRLRETLFDKRVEAIDAELLIMILKAKVRAPHQTREAKQLTQNLGSSAVASMPCLSAIRPKIESHTAEHTMQ